MQSEPPGEIRTPAEKRLEVGTWGVFFVWTGIALLADLGWGVWLVGVGAIILGGQVVRRLLTLRIELFWIVVGALFLVGGVLAISSFEMDEALIPILCITAGASLLVKALSRRTSPDYA